MKRFVISLCLGCAISFSAAAQQAMPSLLISDDPVAVAHAGSSIALNANAFSVENNTAAMSFYEGTMDAAASYGMWQPSVSKNTVIGVGAIGKLGKKLALGLNAKIMMQPAITIVDEQGMTPQLNSTFSPKEYNFAIGCSYMITSRLSAGVNAKLAMSSLTSSAKANCFAADVYAAFKNESGLTAGLGVCNIGSKANYGGEQSYSLPALARAGVGYASAFGLSADAELDYLFSGAVMAAASVGYWYKDYVGLNAGYHYGKDNSSSLCVPSYISAGLGAQVKGVHLDVAYLLGSKTLANTLVLGLGYRF